MDLQPITYRGRTLAACTRNRMFLADELDAHPESPLTEFVIAMCLYAGAVLNGVLPGPYRDRDARAYARACLVPAEVLERAHRTAPAELRAIADWFSVPPEELLAAHELNVRR
jgi:hypothetical protein